MFPDRQSLAQICNDDGEFRLAARFWRGGLVLINDKGAVSLSIEDGVAVPADPPTEGTITLKANDSLWEDLLAPVPARFLNDIALVEPLGLQVLCCDTLYAQYYPAVMRVIELLRGTDLTAARSVNESVLSGQHASPVGRYIHLDILGTDFRVYYESAGKGIPLLLQHTAGCHSAQWRHLMECREITDNFQLIAYDLPFHGKSIPPVSKKWWREEYRLVADFVRQVPVALSEGLNLQKPAFMGASVGGVLALDLARYHPENFSAFISLEGVLKVNDDFGRSIEYMWHPQVSNEYKARAMNALMSPTAPEAYRRETSQIYASGWPPLFLGDLHYYRNEFDLRSEAKNIDTSKTPVYILSGEYDASGRAELGREAHEAIAGSKWTYMKGLGHFPMSEDPEKFLEYLLPVLREIQVTYKV